MSALLKINEKNLFTIIFIIGDDVTLFVFIDLFVCVVILWYIFSTVIIILNEWILNKHVLLFPHYIVQYISTRFMLLRWKYIKYIQIATGRNSTTNFEFLISYTCGEILFKIKLLYSLRFPLPSLYLLRIKEGNGVAKGFVNYRS